MSKDQMRHLPVSSGKVHCQEGKDEPLDRCRFCAHSVRFVVGRREIQSPARAFCSASRATEKIDLKKVSTVICDDTRSEGFRSIMDIIS